MRNLIILKMLFVQTKYILRNSARCLFQTSHSITRKVAVSKQTSLCSSRGISTVGVIGAGQMGTGIAFVAARNAGVDVLLQDQNPTAQKKGLEFIDKLLAKDVAKGKIEENEAKLVRNRVRAIGDLNEMREVDLVIEAVAENLQLKQTIFSELASICKPTTILASNTSSISLTKIAASAIPHTDLDPSSSSRVVPIMSLVEIIAALQTSDKTLKTAREFAVRCGKVVTVSKDTPGFISNRVSAYANVSRTISLSLEILRLIYDSLCRINEAIICLEEGVATRDDIDQTMKRGTKCTNGIGLDTCLSIMQVLYTQTSDSKYRPSVLLSRMVDAGWLGKKVGKGFYEYDPLKILECPFSTSDLISLHIIYYFVCLS
ncbi:hypothetical protein PSHT_13477 [Puccinia striiformis]|uniref:3-hydroxybutyryl-CoA dehydrogenase n=1 Tax=Puccinia striiformis TaxID=27350 RepID=A0A2S4UQE8_9BASI|nr:hypothetical protein PSHT_13477 [Puccinia striiformis]